MTKSFEILKRDVAGRIGKLSTPHGTVETPTVMPVINPNIQLVDPFKMKEMGAEILITNSYIIYRKEKLATKALNDGLHSLIGFDGPIMTDSGSFQLSVYGEVEVDNREIIEFQERIGSDIIVPLDIPTPPDVLKEQAEKELSITVDRLEEARKVLSKTNRLVAGPIQGSTYTDLRSEAATQATKIGFDVYPIGAVVPLMESYRYADLVDVIVSSKMGMNPNYPVHLFGAGHPMMFSLAVALGCDLFDSAAYALYAKDGRYITINGTYHLTNLKYLPCSCPICQNHTVEELKNDNDSTKLLAEHNLYVTFEEIRTIKQAIHEGNLLELVEMRCRSHPRLLDGLKRLYSYSSWLEQYDPVSKSTFFYCGPDSATRPEVLRYSTRLNRFNIVGKTLIRNPGLNLKTSGYDNIFDFKPPFGPYPTELSEVYPFNTELSENYDYEALTSALKNTLKIIENNPESEFTFVKTEDMSHPLLEQIEDLACIIDYTDKRK